MKKLICILALAAPMLMMGQEGSTKDIDKEVLEGRPVMEKPITPALADDCTETGTVVFTIAVDRKGVVKSAEVAKGTTNEASCLVGYFRAIALATVFKEKADGPELQTGTITYKLTPKE
jgi:periplasmic protein TonB